MRFRTVASSEMRASLDRKPPSAPRLAAMFGAEQTAALTRLYVFVMSRDTPQTRILYRAVAACGGVAALATVLEVPVAVLSFWLDGDTVPPVKIYAKALNIVADRTMQAG